MEAGQWPPTRSPYRIEPGEGPRTEDELAVALAPWPDEVARMRAELARAAGPEQRARTVSAWRAVWVMRTHPRIRAALDRLGDGPDPDAVPADVVWAQYDDAYEPRTPPGADGEQER